MSSTSTTSPTTPVAPPVPTFTSIFQSPGGPPLILVCIAAGLLIGAFLGILLMRRMRPTVAVQGVHGLRGFPDPQKTLGEKPKLLDVHIVPRGDSADMTGAGGWGGVLVSRTVAEVDGRVLIRAHTAIRSALPPVP